MERRFLDFYRQTNGRLDPRPSPTNIFICFIFINYMFWHIQGPIFARYIYSRACHALHLEQVLLERAYFRNFTGLNLN